LFLLGNAQFAFQLPDALFLRVQGGIGTECSRPFPLYLRFRRPSNPALMPSSCSISAAVLPDVCHNRTTSRLKPAAYVRLFVVIFSFKVSVVDFRLLSTFLEEDQFIGH